MKKRKNIEIKKDKRERQKLNAYGRLRRRFVYDGRGGTIAIASTYVRNEEAVETAQKALDRIAKRLRITKTYTFDQVSERDILAVTRGDLERAVENGLVKFIQQGFINARDRGAGMRKFMDKFIFDEARTLYELVHVINRVASLLKAETTKGNQSAYQIVWYNKFDEGTLY